MVRHWGDKLTQKDVKVSFRMPLVLKNLVEKYIQRDAHLNPSDLYRDAVREKIQRDAPHLYQDLFREETENEEL